MIASLGSQVLVDNDIAIKAIRYALVDDLWPALAGVVGLAGAAPFVIRDQLARIEGDEERDRCMAALEGLMSTAELVEPTGDEAGLAAEIEFAAARRGAMIDAGESQLAAMVATRGLVALETGDKWAIKGFEQILDDVGSLHGICGRVWCLEQVVRRTIVDEDAAKRIGTAICQVGGVDIAIENCFSCTSPSPPPMDSIMEGLDSYVRDVRRAAPRVLADPDATAV